MSRSPLSRRDMTSLGLAEKAQNPPRAVSQKYRPGELSPPAPTPAGGLSPVGLSPVLHTELCLPRPRRLLGREVLGQKGQE